jgi:hypothetical protein
MEQNIYNHWDIGTTPKNFDKNQTEMIQYIKKLQHTTTLIMESEEWNGQLPCISKARQLFLNDKKKSIRLIPGKSFSVRSSINGHVEEKLMPGVIPTIKKLLFPWSTEDPTKKTRSEVIRRKNHAPYELQKKMRSCPTYGSMHGTIVHSEIAHCIDAIRKPERMIHELIDKVPSPDPCTIRILEILKLKGWIPLESEVPIWDSDMKIATAIDLVAMDVLAQELIIIELKTGYENEEYMEIDGDPFMLYPCESLRDCPDNRHQLQLMMTLLILKVGYNIDIDTAYVVNTCSKRRGANVIEQSDWCKKDENYAKLYDLIVNRNK